VTQFDIRGRAEHVSREQIRSFLHASLCVLAYHGIVPNAGGLIVRVRRMKILAADGTPAAGSCDWKWGIIILDKGNDREQMLTTCLHEVIHACLQFPKDTEEKCVSTLTARLKPDVARIAHTLLDGTYRRAANIAHTRMSYRARNGDHYDPAQHDPVGVEPKYHRRRK
jgi:hypothetical protein